eukprot:3506365-Pyramimonas_sp.AAC.1
MEPVVPHIGRMLNEIAPNVRADARDDVVQHAFRWFWQHSQLEPALIVAIARPQRPASKKSATHVPETKGPAMTCDLCPARAAERCR